MPHPPRIFIAYARSDAPLLQKLRRQLNVLQRYQRCDIFYDGEVIPGERWDGRLKGELHRADIFVLLVTADFLDSDYVNEVELPKALEREAAGTARVIPVVMRDCLWEVTTLRELQVVLKEDRPIEETNAYAHAAREIFRVIEDLRTDGSPKASAPKAKERAARPEAKGPASPTVNPDPFHDLMVHIPGGRFEMGDTFGERYDAEKPVHPVTVPDFYLGKYSVTQGQWEMIMGNNPSHFTGDERLPVEQVSWEDVREFLQKLNEKTGRNYRLPSEAEWEFAARAGEQVRLDAAREGGKKVRFGNGKDIADPAEMNFDASEKYKQPYSVAGAYREKTTPVGSFPPNALGLYDMSGNVWEWCRDVWHDNYAMAPDDGSAWTSGGDQSLRVVRGGSWYDLGPDNCRAANRSRGFAASRYYDIGFRLAR